MVDSQMGAISHELTIYHFKFSISVSGIIVFIKNTLKLNLNKTKNDPKGYAYSYHKTVGNFCTMAQYFKMAKPNSWYPLIHF